MIITIDSNRLCYVSTPNPPDIQNIEALVSILKSTGLMKEVGDSFLHMIEAEEKDWGYLFNSAENRK